MVEKLQRWEIKERKKEGHFQSPLEQKRQDERMVVWEPLFAHLPMKLAGTTLTRRWASIPPSALKTSLTLPRYGCTHWIVRTFLHRIWYNSDNLSPKCACALLIEAVAGALRVSTISLDFRFDHHSLRDKKKKGFHDYVFKLRAKIKVVALHRALFPFMIEKYIVLHFGGRIESCL